MSTVGAVDVKEAAQKYQMVPLELLKPSRSNPRRNFDGPDQRDLVASVREKGIIEPLIVRPSSSASALFEVIAGERRLRAAMELKLPAAPCIVREADDGEVLELQIIENLQRKDVSALEEAHGFKDLLEGWAAPGSLRTKQTVEQIARKVGKSKEYVYGRLKLTDSSAVVQGALTAEKITAGHAILLARLQPKDQAAALKDSLGNEYNGPMSVRELDEYIDREYRLDLAKAPWSPADITLVPAAGACASCPKQAKGRCEDRVCYQGKLAAFIAERRKAHPEAPLVSMAYGRSGNDEKALKKQFPGILWRDTDFREAGSTKCPDTKQALVVHGKPGEVGTQVKVCTNKKCKVHRDPYGTRAMLQPSKAAVTAEKRAKEKAALDGKVSEAALAQLAKVNFELDVEALARIAEVAEEWSYGGPDVIRPKGLHKGHWEKLKKQELVNWIGLCLAASCSGSDGYCPAPDRRYFEALCKRHKIDLGKIRQGLQAPEKSKSEPPEKVTEHKKAKEVKQKA